MCGICGIVPAAGPPDPDLLLRMMSRLVHRGPDGCGYFRDRHATLGHTRLAIIDTAGGAQPLSNEDGSLWITFNGEIFNYVELGEELRRRGHRLRTASDTEVVVHAWEEWGPGCFGRFNGQWALALWDRRARRLVLSRDRLGVRPLYLTRSRSGLLFGSEIKALFADPTVRRAFDPAGIDQTLTYWSPVAPRTAFDGIEQLQPGHYATFDRSGWRSVPYWQPDFAPVGPGSGPAVLPDRTVEVRDRLVEATRLRFRRSDVPVGAYLSGGLDSAITAAVISRFTDTPLHTFSLRFGDDDFDEGPYQRIMWGLLGTHHQEVRVSHGDIAEAFPEVVRHTETPILRAAPAPMYLLSGLVRDSGYKVVVTGEGADEVFAGYDLFREARIRRFWASDPGSARRTRAVELLYPWMARSPGRAPAFARSFFGRDLDTTDPAFSHRPRWQSTAALKSLLDEGWRHTAARPAGATGPTGSSGPTGDPAGLAAAMPDGGRSWDPLARAQWLEMVTLLPGYILASQGDRMLMANSVEGRFPFLDRDVVESAAALPARFKLFGLEEKYILKKAFADLVPAPVRHRPKQPYRAPDAASFFAEGSPDWLHEVTSERAVREAAVFDPARVAALLAKCRRTGGRDLGHTDDMRTVAVLSTQLAHASMIRAGGAPPGAVGLPEMQVRADFAGPGLADYLEEANLS